MNAVTKGLIGAALAAPLGVSCVSDHEIARLEDGDGAGGSATAVTGDSGGGPGLGRASMSIEAFCELLCDKQRECPADVHPSWCGSDPLTCESCEAGCVEELGATVDVDNEFCRVAMEDSAVCFEEASCAEGSNPYIWPDSCDSADRAGDACTGREDEVQGASSGGSITVTSSSSSSGTSGTSAVGAGGASPMNWPGEAVSLGIEGGRSEGESVGISGPFYTLTDELDGGTSTISPATLADADGEICVNGIAGQVMDGEFSNYWGAALHLQLNQPEGSVGDSWDPVEHGAAGFGFTIDQIPQLGQIRFALETEDDKAYCANIYGAGHVQFALEDITEDCWVSGGAPPSGPILDISWWVVTNDAASYPFEFCISDLEVLLE